jgi:hypothetical protein
MLTEQDQILFHGANSTGLRGVYALNMSYGLSSGSTPQVLGGNKLVQVGDVLPDGRPVRNIAPGDTNALGSYATVIGTGNPNTEFDPTNSGLITPNPGLPAAFGGTDDWTPQSQAPGFQRPADHRVRRLHPEGSRRRASAAGESVEPDAAARPERYAGAVRRHPRRHRPAG